jgi:glycerol-3-phosphate dehydrogenase
VERVIVRDPARTAARSYDLVIVGGGVYGASLALEAARRGLAPVLVERGDFGGATSWNSLRIVHGGLRDLQRLDLRRYREMVAERSWFLRHFPDQVRPLGCLMPLYGEGTRRPGVLRAALALNDLLSRGRNRGLRDDRRLEGGRVLSAEETRAAFPAVDGRGLQGGALWHDAAMPDSQRLLVEMLRWACAAGARVLNYAEARELLVEDGRARGVRAVDAVTGAELELRGDAVVNAAGPWCREVARRFDRDVPALFRPSLAFNALLDRPPLSALALAVAPRRPGGRVYFLHPWKGRILAGTYHAPARGIAEGGIEEGPAPAQVRDFLDDLNAAVPELRLGPSDVLRLHWGHLPARSDGSADLVLHERIADHGALGGPQGLVSVSGVKFTTARRVAEKALKAVLRARGRTLPALGPVERPKPAEVPDAAQLARRLAEDPEGARRVVQRIAREEAVLRPEDLLLRRTDWGLDPGRSAPLGAAVGPMLAAAETAVS